MTERAEFEQWYDETTNCNYGVAYYVDFTGKYCHDDVEIAWQAWQAARAQSGQGADLCRCIGSGNGCCCDRCDPQPAQTEGDGWIAVPERAMEYLKDQWPGAYARFYEKANELKRPQPPAGQEGKGNE